MSRYAISDIHGCFSEFQQVLELAGFDDEKDELYILGDIIDRGLEIAECIEWLVKNAANIEGSNVHFILGNHEEMALWSFVGRWSRRVVEESFMYNWLVNGGQATMDQIAKVDDEILDMFQIILEDAPKALAIKIGDEKIVMSHAGVRAPVNIEDEAEWMVQSEDDLLWNARQWYVDFNTPPFHVVSGHLPTSALAQDDRIDDVCPRDVILDGLQNYIMQWNNKHDVDCGCVFGGNMGLLRLDDWKTFHVPRSEYLA